MQCFIQRGDKDKEHPFAQIARALINDKNISCELRFLIIYCISKPDSWQYHVSEMAKSLGKSVNTIYKYLKEGIDSGYVLKTQCKDAKGRFTSVIYDIFEERQIKIMLPLHKKPRTVNCTLSNSETITAPAHCVAKREAAIDVSRNGIEKKFEFEPKSKKTSTLKEEPLEQEPLREDIAAIPVSDSDKRTLMRYTREAIAYGLKCVYAMPEKPRKFIAVLHTLCKHFVPKPPPFEPKLAPAQNFYEKNKSYFKENAQKLFQACPWMAKLMQITTDSVIMMIGNLHEELKFNDAIFINSFNYNIKKIYEKQTRAA